jgi:hypothetical protein
MCLDGLNFQRFSPYAIALKQRGSEKDEINRANAGSHSPVRRRRVQHSCALPLLYWWSEYDFAATKAHDQIAFKAEPRKLYKRFVARLGADVPHRKKHRCDQRPHHKTDQPEGFKTTER